MSVTKQHFVERRMMGKQELAHLYFPHSKQNGHAARDKFMDWVKGCHPLYAKLLELGYTPSVHDFSPKMVDYIFYYLGAVSYTHLTLPTICSV